MGENENPPKLPDPPAEPDITYFYGTREDTEALEKELEDADKDD